MIPPISNAKNQTSIRVLLADDHPALLVGLKMLLEQTSDIVVVAEASDGREALEKVEALRPQVAVLDCHLPEMEGAAVAAEIRRRGLPTRVLALSAYDDEKNVRGMVLAGAVGYILKDEAPGAIVFAVQAVARGEEWFSRKVATSLAAWARGKQPGTADLTRRELDILRLLASGKTNKEIAHTLVLAERTVEFHVSNVLSKLGVGSRMQAALWAKERGLGT
ncbi:MAG: response regulator transcription factor [Dehalococcoidia bacterium]|nr:response regulator transcription factor [Dehalococcoidia bacterium]